MGLVEMGPDQKGPDHKGLHQMGPHQMGPDEMVRFAVGLLGLAWLVDIRGRGPMCFTSLAVITCHHC